MRKKKIENMEEMKTLKEVKFHFDAERNRIICNGEDVSLYDAFRMATPCKNHTEENMHALLKMVPGMTLFQLERILYCGTGCYTDEVFSPLFFADSTLCKTADELKELRQLVAWGCMTEEEYEKPEAKRLLIFWPSTKYFIDQGFLERLKEAGFGPLSLNEISPIDTFEKFIHYDYMGEFLYLDDQKDDPISVATAFQICGRNFRYQNPENFATIRYMFDGLTDFQYNVIALFVTGDKIEYSGEELVRKVPSSDMSEKKKLGELSRMFYCRLLHCTEVTPDISNNMYQLDSSFINTMKTTRRGSIDITTECEVGRMIFPDELKKEMLFYNSEVLVTLEEIQNYLHSENFNKLAEHFIKEGEKLGISCLLEGPSGTGKTAFVKEIARATGRPILMTDIAKLRSKDYGNDEKMIRKVFQEYLYYTCTMPLQPILFVDECETLIGSRTNPDGAANSSIVNMQNTVTNIILEELNDFEGIMFFCTNNACHIDLAIARRLTFQVHIGQPDQSTQVRIWRHFFPDMSEAEAREMANETNFTGGQIFAVKKKVRFKEILSGPVSFEELIRISGSNGRIQKRNPVGFGR